MERTLLRIALLVMLFVLLSADYSSLVSTIFTALGGTVVSPSSAASAASAQADDHQRPTAPGDLGPVRRAMARTDRLNEVDDDDDADDVDDVEDVFDFGGGSTAKLFSKFTVAPRCTLKPRGLETGEARGTALRMLLPFFREPTRLTPRL